MKMKILLSVILAAFLIGCASEFSEGDDVVYLTQAPESYAVLMDQGWAAFKGGDYDEALTAFSAAAERNATLPGVYLGLGWANIRALNLEEGRIYLGLANAFAFLDSANSAGIVLDVKAGLAGIALAEQDYETAVSNADDVLMADAAYYFEHDPDVDASALKRIRMLSSFYLGDYTAAFQEVLASGMTMANAVHEIPASGSVSSLSVLASGTTVGADVLSSDWLQVSAPGHSLSEGDYVVLTGVSDGGDVNLTALADKVTRGNGFSVNYIIDANTFLLTALNAAEAGQVTSLATSSPMFHEGTGLVAETADAQLSGEIGVDIYSGRQLIAVNSVSKPGGTSTNYEIIDVDAGNTQFQVFGNPVFTAGHRVSVDYYYTHNFGEFLSDLVEIVSNI